MIIGKTLREYVIEQLKSSPYFAPLMDGSTRLDLGHKYKDDLPFHSSLSSELHCWIMKWRNQERNVDQLHFPLPTTLYHTLPQSSSMFPNITVLLWILHTPPFTPCTSESPRDHSVG